MPSTLLPRTTPTQNFLSQSRFMRFGILFTALFLSHFLMSQQKCGTVVPSSGEFENWISSQIARKSMERQELNAQATVYQIPVVVHVFHKGESEGLGVNLSEARIRAQIDSLTADFRRLNADTVNTPNDFLSVATDIEIEFVLAKQDPEGNPTDGIVRIDGLKEVYRVNTDKGLLRSESFWSPDNYLNIYVADLQVFIGYASFPVTTLPGITNESDDFVIDGVYVDYQYFGVNPDAPSFESRGRTLTHEVGHYLGLRHIWGDASCSGDDFVTDTPTARFDHGGTTSPCTYPIPDNNVTTQYDEGNTCTEEDDPDLPDMFQNYMDYTDDICMNLFTMGQKTRMRTVLENSPRRASLISSPGLNEPIRFENDLAATNILSPSFGECDNQITPTLEVTNYGTTPIFSYDVQLLINGNPFGTVESVVTNLDPLKKDTIVLPNRFLSSPGTVSFEVLNVNGLVDGNTTNNTIAKAISHIESTNLPYTENFEGGNSLLGQIGAAFTWEVATAPREIANNQAISFKSFGNTSSFGPATIIETPPLDLNGVQSAAISFSFAHAPLANGFFDGLVVEASSDCGENYTDVIFSASGNRLQTTAPTTTSFTPANSLQWMDTTLGISSYRDFDGVQFRFIGLNGGGNNIYVDNIVIEETNVLENDVSLQSLKSPLVTCDDESQIQLRIRNAGSEVITSFSVAYQLNGVLEEQSFGNINIEEREYASFNLEAGPLNENENAINITVTEVNGVMDNSETGNSLEATITQNLVADEFPLNLDFETPTNWINAAPLNNSLWEETTTAGNGVLKAKAFDAATLGTESWYISPALTTGGLDSAGLYFRASYASRIGLTDQLQVLLSTDCGENYNRTILTANSDSLAVATTTNQWLPTSDDDWKEFRLDLSEAIPFKDDIRVAFVFTNGNGNDLYIDDISIRGNEPPEYETYFRVFPNPATFQFNLGFNLMEKDVANVTLIDMSGRIIFTDQVPNALNQVITIEAPSKGGLYFIRVDGTNFSQTQKLYINR